MFCITSTWECMCSWKFVFGFVLLLEVTEYKMKRNAKESKHRFVLDY